MINPKLSIFIIVTGFIIASCSDVPELPEEGLPIETYIISGPQDGEIVTGTSVVFQFAGNSKFVSEFSYRCLPQQGKWSEWSPVTYIKLEYLNQGSYIFEVKGRYEQGNEDDTPIRRTFSINIPGPGMLIEPLYHKAKIGEEFSLDVIADELIDIPLAHIVLRYQPSKLRALDVTSGELFQNVIPAFYKSIDDSQGLIDISMSTIGAEPPKINGTVSIITVKFMALALGKSNVEFLSSSEFRNSANESVNMVSRIGAIAEVVQ